jgi:hypothetical protein
VAADSPGGDLGQPSLDPTFHFGTLRIADVKETLAAAGHPVR